MDVHMSKVTLFAACVMLMAKGALSGGHCNGMGRRFCADMSTRAQHYAGKCPEPCKERNCKNRKSTELLRSGADRRGPDPKWEEIVFDGLYEHVYIHEKYMCVGSCWKEPWKSKCDNWETRFGKKYCKKLTCDHDKATRYSGCHRGPGGKRKLPWHKPTCKECAHVFPVACFNELKEYYDDDVREEISRRAREETLELELNARKYCYLAYFGPVLGIDMPSDSDDTPSTKQSESDQSARRLLSSSSESSGDSFDSVLKPDDVDKFRLMEKDGDLTCPPPQCMTKHDTLLKPLVAPWYHVTKQGSCKWNGCNGRPMGNEWCQENVDSCISCRGTWCPPRLVPFWSPVMADNYQSRKPILPVADFTSIFPRAACKNNPITDIQKADARALPWTDFAGDVMTPHFLERPLEPEDADQIKIIREKLEQDWLSGLPLKERREAIRLILDREKADNEALKQADEAAEHAVKNYLNKQQQQLVQQARQQDSSPQGPAANKQAAAAKKRAAQRARELEESARAYCHLSYVNEAEAFGGLQGRQSIGGRSLLQAPKSSLPQAMLRKFSKMQMLEQIRCPPAECYFADIQDQDDKIADKDEMESSRPQDQAAEDAAVEWSLRVQLPWYHRMDAGYCTWSPTCDGKTGVKGTYCSASAENCVKRCSKGIWCPPFSFLNWDPVVSSNYTSLKKAMRALSGNPNTNNRNNADSATVNSMQAAQSGTSSATLTSFDFSSCQKKPVTGITLSAAEGLEWPGMIDIVAAAAAAQNQKAGLP